MRIGSPLGRASPSGKRLASGGACFWNSLAFGLFCNFAFKAKLACQRQVSGSFACTVRGRSLFRGQELECFSLACASKSEAPTVRLHCRAYKKDLYSPLTKNFLLFFQRTSLLFSNDLRSSPSLEQFYGVFSSPGQGGRGPEKTFALVITRPIASEHYCFCDLTIFW